MARRKRRSVTTAKYATGAKNDDNADNAGAEIGQCMAASLQSLQRAVSAACDALANLGSSGNVDPVSQLEIGTSVDGPRKFLGFAHDWPLSRGERTRCVIQLYEMDLQAANRLLRAKERQLSGMCIDAKQCSALVADVNRPATTSVSCGPHASVSPSEQDRGTQDFVLVHRSYLQALLDPVSAYRPLERELERKAMELADLQFKSLGSACGTFIPGGGKGDPLPGAGGGNVFPHGEVEHVAAQKCEDSGSSGHGEVRNSWSGESTCSGCTQQVYATEGGDHQEDEQRVPFDLNTIACDCGKPSEAQSDGGNESIVGDEVSVHGSEAQSLRGVIMQLFGDGHLAEFGNEFACVTSAMASTVNDLRVRLGDTTTGTVALEGAKAQSLRGSFMRCFMEGLFADFGREFESVLTPMATALTAFKSRLGSGGAGDGPSGNCSADAVQQKYVFGNRALSSGSSHATDSEDDDAGGEDEYLERRIGRMRPEMHDMVRKFLAKGLSGDELSHGIAAMSTKHEGFFTSARPDRSYAKRLGNLSAARA
eukprot:TRINITY_DN14570_c0_g1_i1.p1 TRINITY_DN14570_c0_g1~~TRINITY_DN14570_c0_g1_i1.p1  ORF type:complete len:538 (-),score=89.37 TRINITY_DN14570_c0_g1_i1:104-1717(-)